MSDHEMHDVHFTVTRHPEPDDSSSTHILEMREWVARPADAQWPCETLTLEDEPFETHITGDPFGFVEAFRETQEYSLEERLGEYGIEWQREQGDRRMNR